MNAREVLSYKQKIIFLILALIFISGIAVDYRATVIIILSFLTLFYFIHIIISIYISLRSIFAGQEIKISEDDLEYRNKLPWPKYTILCPLFKEANMIRNYVDNLSALDYPKDRLECLLLLEEDDTPTIEAAKKYGLPDFFRITIIPDSYPKTKPKACNVGLKYANGEYVVIYDAEDKPDTDQLKKAIIAFDQSDDVVGCVQAKLNYYNPGQNFLTKMFTSEYSLWFDLILPGLQSIDAPIPLGGTSNHFKTKTLRELNGWDAYNVTEDCDLGVRLKESGYKTVILDSTTLEEANSELKNWIRQRSRWIKGYFQTFLVHTRDLILPIKKIGLFNFILFSLTTGFLPFAVLINPFLWLTTISYFVFRPTLGPIIEQFYPPFLLYPAVICLVFGNFLYVYNYLIGTSKRELSYLTKYGLLMPIYWVLISIAGWYAIIQLVIKPHYWEKTKHGLFKEGVANA